MRSERRYPATLQSLPIIRQDIEFSIKKYKLDASKMNPLLVSLTELASNLCKHSSPPPDYIDIGVTERDSILEVSVKDNGGPIPDSVILHFSQQDDFSLFDELKENGMGISLIKHYFPDSTYLPGDAGEPNQFILPIKIDRIQPSIVVIDDDILMCELFHSYLDANYKVHTFTQANEALEYLITNGCDLVISDIEMPDINGLVLRSTLANAPKTDLIPFVFITGLVEEETLELVHSLPTDDVLLKPVTKSKLERTVQRVLTRTKQVIALAGKRLDASISATLRPTLPDQIGEWSVASYANSIAVGGGDLVLCKSYDEMSVIVLADVMGHDLQAKFFAHAYAGYLSGLAWAIEEKSSASAWLNQLSEAASNSPVLNQTLVTACVICLMPNGKVTIATAGHPPPLLFSQRGVTEVKVSGILPGLLPNQQYSELELTLAPEDILFAYTDGLFDHPHSTVSKQDLIEELKQEPMLPIKSWLNNGIQRIRRRITEFSDDVTLIALSPSKRES